MLAVGLMAAFMEYGCLCYADDILLISQSMNAMRQMLTICDEFALCFDVRFNSTKSVALKIGKRFPCQLCAFIVLARSTLKFVDTVKYLCIYLFAANKWKVSADHVKLRFYRVLTVSMLSAILIIQK